MSPEEREAITRSIANLWTFNAIFISRLAGTLRDSGLPAEEIEAMLQSIDEAVDILDGEDDRGYATGLLAAVRTVLAGR